MSVGLFLYIRFSAEVKFNVIFFDIGQGDAALITFDNGTKMLVDCGPDRTILNKLGKYLPFYDRTIDYLLITHPDNDHYGGCVDVLRRYQVKNIFTNGEQKINDEYWRVWRSYEAEEKAKMLTIKRPIILTVDDIKLEFISPDPSLILEQTADSANNKSLVFRLRESGIDIMFTGDMETIVEDALVKKYCSSPDCPDLKADILKVGHHGSDTSSGEDFLDAVAPKAAIISAGHNSFGHPSLRVLRKLERVGALIWRTDEKGDVKFDNIIEAW